jgi:hypothetical protein
MRAQFFGVAVVLLLITASSVHAQYAQQGAKFLGSGAAGTANQGRVAISADGSTMIEGGSADNTSQGAAWVFARSGNMWIQQGAKLVGSGVVAMSAQGSSVAISADGNTAAVGGVGDNSNIGAVWVFVRNGGVWSQQGPKLVGSAQALNSAQGSSVALSADGNTMMVGGRGDNLNQGAVWVFTRSGGVWTQQGAKLIGTGNVGAAQQGWAVALSSDGNTAIVGGLADNSNAGASWVFIRNAGVWTQQGSKLVAIDAVGAARQGAAVALSSDGNSALVGGYSDNTDRGASWVFVRNGSVWSQQGPKLIGAGAGAAATQGTSVALSGDGNTAMVGATSDNGGAGSVWTFLRSSATWYQQNPRISGTGAVGPAGQGGFGGLALSTDGNWAVVGGISDNSGVGAVWAFERAVPTIVSMKDVPNDQGGKVSVRWNASPFDVAALNLVNDYFIWRQVPATRAATLIKSGSRLKAQRGGDAIRDGNATIESAQIYYWELIGEQAARRLPGYSFTATTLSDSVPGSNPYT